MTDIRGLFLTTTVDLSVWLAEQRPALEERFEGPSVLGQFSVRGLAGHLRRAMTSVDTYLDRSAPEAGPGAGGQEPDDRLVQVYGDLVLALDEYLVTRLIELVVHADDLAASLDVEPPPLSPQAIGRVIGTLVDVARIRHGDFGIVRALTRRERDAVDALRVL